MKAASSEWYNTKTRHVLPDPVSSGQRLFDSNSRYAGYTSTNSSSTRRSHSLSNSNPLGSTSTSFSNRSSRSRSNSTTTEPTTSTTSSTSTSTNANQYKGNRLFVPSIPETETEISETEVAFTEDDEDEEDEEDDDISSAHVPTDEASSTDQDEEEDDDDEQVYSSFKNDLRMLKVQRRQSRSPSPAVSMRSVLTDLEEDEEDLPPDEVDDEVQSTTEEEEEEEEEDEGMMTSASNSNSTSSSYHSSSVPKSPMKVRVKVEKSVPHDDRVKVTVLLEESEISDDEEEDEDEEDASEDTTTTAETVKYCSEDKDRTEGESYDESSDEQGESESESEDELSEEENKADSRILSRDKDVGIDELTLPPVPSRIPQPQRPSIPTRSQTVHETRNESNINLKSSESKSSKSSSSGTSSRSQSARSSLTGGVSSIKKMYSVGGKPRSLSARRSVATSSSPHPPLQVQLSVESPTPSDESPAGSLKGSSSSSGQSSRLPSGDSSAVAMTKYVSLAPPGKIPLIMHHAKSLSAKSSRGSQFSAALRQLSLGNLKEGKESESEQGLPPIVSTPPSSSESNAGNKGKTKKHPLLRTNTYVISSTVSEESSTQPSNSGSIPSQSSSQLSLQKMSKLDLSERSNSLTSSANKLQWMSSTHSSSSQQSISDIISALKKAPIKDTSQVSFASEVIEHSLSTTKTNSTSRRSGSSSTSSSRASSGKKREPPRGWPANKADVIHKEIITYGELEQESIDDNETGVNEEDDKLRQHALNTIRQQMKHEMKMQTLRQKFHPTSDPEDEDSEEDDDEDDEDGEDDVELGSSSEYSEEEASIAEKKPEKTESHIPLPAETEPQSGVAGDIAPLPASANQLTVPDMMTISKDSEASKESQTSEEQPTINKSEESGWSWKDEIGTNFDDDDDSPINSRIPSAESGYRAMPPSPASSKDNLSRQASLESEDLEKEKERLLEEWRRGGGSGAPPTITQTATSDGTTVSMKLPGMDGISPEDAFHLIKGGIDLTQDMPNEEKKIAVVWNEFNRDEQSGGAMADYEFSNLLDEMIQDTNNYKANGSNAQLNHSTSSQSLQVSNLPQSPSASPQKFHPSRKYQSFSQMVSLLSHNLRLVSSETLEDHMASLISLVSSILKKVRKNKSEDEYITQIACLSTIRVLCDRIQEMQTSQNLKYADLSWLFRILCKYSSDSDSKIRPEASFCLARLVKVAGPALVVRPIYFILVMESEGGTGKTTTGAKTKASAIDTLTYALLTFPKEEFHNLEEIAGWVK
ncbi:unnamed protein product [Orchesella dallaii]|uniref:Uncharacterized protein n=1 Tax=Orchesella dallaii TaxID=48710 RepID=A0ABP1Q725_9HEXA